MNSPLDGVHTLHTYWVRFADGDVDHAAAVANRRLLIDTVGPQTVTLRELVDAVNAAVRSRALIVPAPARLIPLLAGAIGSVLRDMRPALRPPARQSLR